MSLEPLPTEPTQHPLRSPAAPLVIVAGIGIAIDRMQDPPGFVWWAILASCVIVAWWFQDQAAR
ncbi:MAG: hypothetical protein B7Z55_02245, partial [Planctomycetales bacterium 12-60-4]